MEPSKQDRIDAWFDASAICVIAVGSHGDPVDIGEDEVEALIQKLQNCLRQARNS
jgi:predicted amidohydrolase